MSRPSKFSTHLSRTSPLLLDGALATYLENLGADINGALWSADLLLKNPALIKRAHIDYFRAGANIAITASYQASIPGLRKHSKLTEDEAKELIKESVAIAQEARHEVVVERLAVAKERGDEGMSYESLRAELFIAGSVGPYGAFLADGSEYRGDYNLPWEEMKAFHRGRIAALVDTGVDVLACETIPSRAETEALLELLTTEFPETEAWFSFTLRDREHISDGTPLAEIVVPFEGVEQVVALGVNCVPDDLALEALEFLAPLQKERTLIGYPNSGEQWNAQAREWEGKRTEGSTLAEKTVQWWKAGAGLIGGCCRTTPEDIGVMKRALEAGRKVA